MSVDGGDESDEGKIPFPPGVTTTPTPWTNGGYLYRPGELLVATDALEVVRDHLRRMKADEGEEETLEDLGIHRLRVGVDVPTLVSQVRSVSDGPVSGVAPNHIFHPFSHWRYYTTDAPIPAPRRHVAESGPQGSGMVVAVVDSGASDHEWFAGRVAIGPTDVEGPDENGNGALDLSGGHGTFVAGVVLQHAPGASVVADGVLDGYGIIDDVALARALDRLDASTNVVNISLGCWTHDDVAPPATGAAIGRLRERASDCVLVAAAGNEPQARPTWPAAFKGVIAVGALDDGRQWSRSAFGWWVDAWAEGVKAHSTFFQWDGPMEHPLGHASTFDGWAYWTGTSFAAPRVAGAIAALAADRPDRSARRAASELLDTSPVL